jgi:hypothetical protein
MWPGSGQPKLHELTQWLPFHETSSRWLSKRDSLDLVQILLVLPAELVKGGPLTTSLARKLTVSKVSRGEPGVIPHLQIPPGGPQLDLLSVHLLRNIPVFLFRWEGL